MKWRLVIVLIAALLALGAVSRGICRAHGTVVIAEDNSSSDEDGEEYSDFA